MRLESVCPRQHLDSSKQRKKCLSCSPCPPPRVIDHYLQTEIFSGEKMSPAFRIQYLPWLCSAFAGIRGLQQFWGSHSLPSQILTPLGPSPVLALYPNVTQRLARFKVINDSSNQRHPDRQCTHGSWYKRCFISHPVIFVTERMLPMCGLIKV